MSQCSRRFLLSLGLRRSWRCYPPPADPIGEMYFIPAQPTLPFACLKRIGLASAVTAEADTGSAPERVRFRMSAFHPKLPRQLSTHSGNDRFAAQTVATAVLRKRLSTMPSDAAYFREHAAHCRELAQSARDQPTINMLLELAEDFDAEASKLDVEEGAGANPRRF